MYTGPAVVDRAILTRAEFEINESLCRPERHITQFQQW